MSGVPGAAPEQPARFQGTGTGASSGSLAAEQIAESVRAPRERQPRALFTIGCYGRTATRPCVPVLLPSVPGAGLSALAAISPSAQGCLRRQRRGHVWSGYRPWGDHRRLLLVATPRWWLAHGRGVSCGREHSQLRRRAAVSQALLTLGSSFLIRACSAARRACASAMAASCPTRAASGRPRSAR